MPAIRGLGWDQHGLAGRDASIWRLGARVRSVHSNSFLRGSLEYRLFLLLVPSGITVISSKPEGLEKAEVELGLAHIPTQQHHGAYADAAVMIQQRLQGPRVQYIPHRISIFPPRDSEISMSRLLL